MPQGDRTSVFTFDKLINNVFGPIYFFMPELLLPYAKIPKNSTLLAFYIDDIFEIFKT